MQCDRCDTEVRMHILSKFNEDELCMACKSDEEAAPGYEAASRAEELALRHGDANFKGIGLAKRDREFLRNALNYRQRFPFAVGSQVRMKQAVERYPHALVKAGETGKLKTVRHDLVEVELDNPYEGLEEWKNCLQWYPENVPEHQQEVLQDLEAV